MEDCRWDTNRQKWLEEVYEKLKIKMKEECKRAKDKIPYSAKDGVFDDRSNIEQLNCWTNGFWAGMLWQMYHATNEDCYKEAARIVEEKFDYLLDEYIRMHHDVGFMWLHTAVADYRLTGDEKARVRGLHAASLLVGRFNPAGKYIPAWNGEDKIGWIIIDSMMNIPLLYWASRELKDPRFDFIARAQADKELEMAIRPDGSSNHICCLDPLTGEMLDNPGGQGYESGSSWSRGQAWALYGFALSYHHTKDQKYLDAAKRVAHYFIASVVRSDFLPLCDFRQPAEPVYYDSTAGACAACGLLEIAEQVPELEKDFYIDAAFRILQAMEEKWCDWDPNRDSILQMGTAAYHDRPSELHVPIIYGDYFFIEAILRLMGKDFLIW